MGRFDTGRRTPPVRIGLALARTQAAELLTDSARESRAAGDYGMREARFAPVPIRLRIDRSVGPNTAAELSNVRPLGRTQRKQGYPEVTEGTMFGATPSA